jgi:hypothetical protein
MTSVAVPALARAQRAGPSVAVAEDYFRQASKAMEAHDYEHACPLFAESQRLDPQIGTLLNLARCHELQGKTASAWGEYSEVAALSQKANQAERAKYAKDAAAKLEPSLIRITIDVAEPAKDETLKLDGSLEIGSAVWGKPLPIDPGKHVLDAAAPGKKPASVSFVVDTKTTRVVVPKLADEPKPVLAATTGDGASEGSGRRTVGFVLMGVGVAGLAVGSIVGLVYLGKRSDYNDCGVVLQNGSRGFCPDPDRPGDAAAAEKYDDSLRTSASTSGLISTIGFGIGIAGVAAGAFVLLTGSGGSKQGAGPQRPQIHAGPTGVLVRGEF